MASYSFLAEYFLAIRILGLGCMGILIEMYFFIFYFFSGVG